MKSSHVDLARYVLERVQKAGAQDVVVSLESRNAQQTKFSNNLVNATKRWQLDSLSLFAAVDKKLVSTSIRSLTKEDADLAVDKLMSSASAIPKNEDYRGIAKGPFEYKELKDAYDPKIAELDSGAIDIVEDAIKIAKEKGATRCAGVFETYTDESYLLTSGGVETEEKGTRAYFSVRCFAAKDASGHTVAVSRMLDGLDYKGAVAEAARVAVIAKEPKAVEAGTYDVVFDPLPFANLLAHVGASASIFSVEAGLSFLADKVGKRVGSDILTIVDEGRVQGGLHSGCFDAEGVPTQKTVIVDKGVLKGYLHNTSTGRRHGVKTTANAGLVSPEPTNLVVKPGKYGHDELISQMKKGLYVSNIWYTRFQNYSTGDFSTIPRDGIFLVEDGKIVGPVKDIRISDNVIKMLKNVAALGKDVHQVFGWEVETPIFAPPVLIRDVTITRSER